MLSTLVHTVLFVALATSYVAASMQIDTPTLTQVRQVLYKRNHGLTLPQCQSAAISYSGGQGNYGLYVVPSNDPCADSV